MTDKRDLERVGFKERLKIMDPHSGNVITSDARLREISKQGFSFLTDEKINRGGTYKFQIDLMSGLVDMKARVVHLKTDSVFSIAGAHIESISLSNRFRLNRFLLSKSQGLQWSFLLRACLAGAVTAGLFKFVLGASIPAIVITFFLVSTLSFVLFPF